MSRYSVSRVQCFLKNPWEHYCKYILGYKEIYNAEYNKYMDRGTVMHKALELWADSKDPTKSQEELKEQVTEFFKDSGFSEHAYEAGFTALDRYVAEWGTYPENIIHTEYQLDYTLPSGNEFIGFIDAMVQNPDGTVTLYDYKTYGSAPDEVKHKFSLQANMYMAVATRLGFKVKRFVYRCVNPGLNIRKNAYRTREFSFRYNETLCNQTFEQFDMLVQMIESFPDFCLYTPGDYQPNNYDYLYRIYMNDIMEDLDSFTDERFIIGTSDKEEYKEKK